MTKRALNFKLEYGKEEVTPYAGLGLYGEMFKALGLAKEINMILPKPGSGKGFEPAEYVKPLVMMFIGGGKYIEDIRKIQADKGLRKICNIEEIPGADAIGDWLRRVGWRKAEKLNEVNDNFTRRIIKKSVLNEFTLDIDATEIPADKYYAEYTYKGNKGYMPLLGFIPELDWCCGYEFRAGNVAPQDKNYEFTKGIMELVKGVGKTIKRFRSDSAGYQARLFNYLNGEGAKYTITADQDEAVKGLINQLSEGGSWKEVNNRDGIKTDREYCETVHSMEKTGHSFRLVVQRWKNPEQDLFKRTSEYCYHVIATNYLEEEKNAQEVIRWHNGRSNSENYNKELKSGFNLDYMPCGELAANAVWFGIGILAYNLFIASKIYLFPRGWIKKTITTVRWQFIQLAGRIIRRSRYVILRICGALRETFEMYRQAREICKEMQFIL